MTRFQKLLCVVIFSASPSALLAEALTWGQLDVDLGKNHISDTEGEADGIFDRNPTTLDLSGRIGADWGAFGAQLDLNYSSQNIPDDQASGYLEGNFATLRANYDVSAALTFGAFYGAGQSTPAADPRADLDFYGLETAYASGAFMLGGQLGAFDSEDSADTNAFHDGRFVRLSGLYALGESGAIEAELGYFDGKQDSFSSYDMYATTWGVKYSRQFGANPMAWSVGVDGGGYSNGDDGDNGKFAETRVTLGLSAWFGDDSLSSAKRRGIFGQPDFARIVASGNNVD